MRKILIVEDDRFIREGLLELLGTEYLVKEAETCKTAWSILEAEDIQLCLLDVNLPDGTGYQLCKRIREISDVPILFLTVYGDEENIARGLDTGGDDYVVKPFSTIELKSRIRALLRRSGQKREDVIQTKDMLIEKKEHKVWKNGEELVIPMTEFQILVALAENSGCLVTRECLLRKIWDDNGTFVEDNTLNVFVSRLRKRLGTYEGETYFETVRGIGYRWKQEG